MAKAKVSKPAAGDAKINFKIRVHDGATFEGKGGSYPNEVAFGIYMLICGWGAGEKDIPKTVRGVKFERAARAYRKAAREFYETSE